MPKLTIRDIDLTNKRVFIRVDFNVPLTEDGSTITDDTRIVATLPTIIYALQRRAKVILASHLGRPKGKPNPKYSLRPVVDRLRELLNKKLGESVNVAFSPDCIGELASEMARQLESGQVLLLENLRFHAEDWEAVGRVHGEYFGTIRPASTMVVAALLNPKWCAEIEMEAVVPESLVP